MKTDLSETLHNIAIYALAALAAVLPLFFLPITTEFFEFQKNVLLIVATLVLLLLSLASWIASRRIRIVLSPLFIPLGFLVLAFVLSVIFASQNKLEPFITPGSTGTIITLTILSFIIVNLLYGHKRTDFVLYGLAAGSAVMALLSILAFSGILRFLPVPEYMKLPTFTPAGTLAPLAVYLGVTLVWITSRLAAMLGLDEDGNEQSDVFDQLSLAWSKAWQHRSRETKERKTHMYGLIGLCIAAIVILAGFGTSIYQLTTTSQPLLPLQFGWQISLEALKDWKTALVGVGPNNFLSAFTRFRPLGLNATDQWNVRFTNSSNTFLHYLTTIGFLGFAAFLGIFIQIYRLQRQQHKVSHPALFYSLYALFIACVLAPPSILVLFLLFVFVALIATEGAPVYVVEESTLIASTILSVIILLVAGAIVYYGFPIYKADMLFRESLVALGENRGLDVYNKQREAINLFPMNDLYRATFAQTNLALATNLSRRAIATGSGQLSNEDRQTISVLIQQAIREAKTAVALNPQKVTNWENLGQIYRSLINIAQGADVWTIQVYQQAVALDPTNPQLRLILGGVYYALGLFDEAISQFQLAVNLKPNHANAYYNLAAAFREKKDIRRAYQAMQASLANLPINAPDRERVTRDLEDLRRLLPKEEASPSATQTEFITPPQPAPTGLKPPIPLPTENAPEVTVRPTRVPTRSVTPTTIP